MKRILPLFFAVFTFSIVTAQQKAPLKEHKMDMKSTSSSVVFK